MTAKYLLGAALLGFFLPALTFAGFGISPPSITEDRLVAGSHLEKTIYLVQGNPAYDIGMEITVDSPDISDWISFTQGTDFVIPAGVQQFPLGVVVDVPEDAELGVYRAFIRISTKPEKATEDGQVAIALGGRVDVTLTVGDDVVYDYTIKNIEILDVAEGDDPEVSVTVENLGNVPAAPAGASFELFNKFGNIRLAYADAAPELFGKVASFSTGKSVLSFPIDVRLAAGEYWGHVQIYNEDNEVVKELRTVFNVHEKSLGGAWGIMLGSAGGVILVVLIALWIIRRKQKRRTNTVPPPASPNQDVV